MTSSTPSNDEIPLDGQGVLRCWGVHPHRCGVDENLCVKITAFIFVADSCAKDTMTTSRALISGGDSSHEAGSPVTEDDNFFSQRKFFAFSAM